ncbi:MAG: protease inhibitor I42 family protein [Peptococcaceae bacterium]|nr:protease inhibitor I42 family protein [Peptococcaceae bacterium]
MNPYNTSNTMTVTVGTEFEQLLQATPSAGYRWTINNLPVEFEFLEKTLKTSARNAPGDMAMVAFKLKALRVGEYVIEFMYKRPWENLGNTFKLIVKVLPRS